MGLLQTNTVEGRLAFTADADLTGKEGYLVKLTTGTDGKAEVTLPTDVADVTPFVIVDVPDATYTAGNKVYVQPLSPNSNIRLVAAGTITAGDKVIASGTFGKVVTATGAASDVYFVVGYAEEDATAGGWVRVRPAFSSLTV